MMDFFHQQDVARRKSFLLLSYFVLALVAMIVGLYAVVLLALDAGGSEGLLRDGVPRWWNPSLLAGVTVGVLSIVFLGSLYKTLELRGGGESLAISLGGRRINPETTDLSERRLLNVVEEMALASGVPVPPVFVLDNEQGINAFAAGFLPGDAVIGVNRGTLEHLSRDELQGVIAHEFSHILNGDMRLNLRLIGLLHGILLLAIIGYFLIRMGGGSGRSRSGKKGGGGQLAAIGFGMWIIGYVGLFFARLIKAAVSRQREYLADAAAVQFTRNPDGIGGALKKIGGLYSGSFLQTPEAETASHMFFGSAIRGLWFPGFATHPPLPDRIRRIDPQFDGTFPKVLRQAAAGAAPPVAQAGADRVSRPISSRPPVIRPPRAERHVLDPFLLLASVGTPVTDHVSYARELLQALPAELQQAVHNAFSARAVILAMLLGSEPELRRTQAELIEKRLGAPTREATLNLAPQVAAQGVEGRLPLIELVLSTLRQLSADQYQAFREAVIEVALADRKLSLFEFTVQRSLLKRLDRHFDKTRPSGVRYPALGGLRNELAIVLSALAHVGTRDSEAKTRAFDRGWDVLELPAPGGLQPVTQCGVAAIGQALDKLAQSSPAIKKRLLHAAALVIAADGQVTADEAELLRAIGDSLECPVPPIFAGALPADIPSQRVGETPA